MDGPLDGPTAALEEVAATLRSVANKLDVVTRPGPPINPWTAAVYIPREEIEILARWLRDVTDNGGIADGCDDVVITPEEPTNPWTVWVHLSRGESEVVVEMRQGSVKLHPEGWRLAPPGQVFIAIPR